MLLTRKRYRKAIAAVYKYIDSIYERCGQSANAKITNLRAEIQVKLDHGTEVMVSNQDRIRDLERQTTGRPNKPEPSILDRYLDSGFMFGHAGVIPEKKAEYSLQEQIDHIHEHLGLEYKVTAAKDAETKLAKTKRK